MVVQKPSFTYQQGGSPIDDAANGGPSPSGPTSARSSSTTPCHKDDKDEPQALVGDGLSEQAFFQQGGQSLVDAISTAMIFQANNFFKVSILYI